jgi:hypothetical protein
MLLIPQYLLECFLAALALSCASHLHLMKRMANTCSDPRTVPLLLQKGLPHSWSRGLVHLLAGGLLGYHVILMPLSVVNQQWLGALIGSLADGFPAGCQVDEYSCL